MRSGNRFGFRAAVAIERRPYPGEGKQGPVIIVQRGGGGLPQRIVVSSIPLSLLRMTGAG